MSAQGGYTHCSTTVRAQLHRLQQCPGSLVHTPNSQCSICLVCTACSDKLCREGKQKHTSAGLLLPSPDIQNLCVLLARWVAGDDVTTTGHSSLIYSIAWKPDDPQVLVSGGWDRTIQVGV
jgi:WD40 repeat protein